MSDDRSRLHLSQAVVKFQQGKLEEAVGDMSKLCQDGYPPAQVFLGWMNEGGRGIPVSPENAQRYYTQAADAGDAVGQYYLGVFLIRRGDLSAGRQWLREAAKQRYAPALYRLGQVSEQGQVNGSDDDCTRYMREAAALGHPMAQRWIAVRGLRGRYGLMGFMRGLWWFISVPVLAVRLGWHEPSDENLLQP